MRTTIPMALLAALFLCPPVAGQPISQEELTAIIDEGNQLVWLGEYAAASANFEKAIAESEWDTGKSYATQISYDHGLDPKRKAYGEAELARILKDRPHMNAHGIAESEIGRWCARRLAGIEIGKPVKWSNDPPHGTFFADHGSVGNWIEIRIAKELKSNMEQRLFEASWCALVFELINATHWNDFNFLRDLAQRKEITRDGYIKGMFRNEMAAMAKCRAFYARVFLPWAEEAEILSHPDIWFTELKFWGTPDSILAVYHSKTGYPWANYGSYYNTIAGLTSESPQSESTSMAENPVVAIAAANEVAATGRRITNEGGTAVIIDDKIKFHGGRTVIHGGKRTIYVEAGELTINGGANNVFDLRTPE